MTAWTLSERDMRMPMGRPTTIDINVHTTMIDSVRMVSSHMPKMPISIRAIKVPAVIPLERLANQTMATRTAMTIHQGV